MSIQPEPGPLWRVLADPDVYGQPIGTPVWPTNLAERILADPAPLLAALAEAGVLDVEHATPNAVGVIRRLGDLHRYVTDWTEEKP